MEELFRMKNTLKRKIELVQYDIDVLSFRIIEAMSILDHFEDEDKRLKKKLIKLEKKLDLAELGHESEHYCHTCDCINERFCNEHCECECCEYLDFEDEDEQVGEGLEIDNSGDDI